MSHRYLKDPSMRPKDGWAAVQPEDGFRITASTRPKLRERVLDYRKANNFEIWPNFELQLHNQICSTMGDAEAGRRCRFEDEPGTPKELQEFHSRSEQVEKFAQAASTVAVATILGRPSRVPQAEAERRAGICAGCQHNKPVANCMGCGLLGKTIRKLAGNLRTQSDSLLLTCDVCGCANTLQVHYTDEILREIAEKQDTLTGLEFPSYCWKKSITEQV